MCREMSRRVGAHRGSLSIKGETVAPRGTIDKVANDLDVEGTAADGRWQVRRLAPIA